MADDPRIFRVESRCRCGRVLDAVGDAEEREAPQGPPKRGDITVCLYCGSVLAHDGTRFLPITDDQIRALTSDQIASIAEVRAFIHRFTPPPSVH